MTLEDDVKYLRQKILVIISEAQGLANIYRHGPYGRTHFKEVGLLGEMMLIQLEYVLSDSGDGGHDGRPS